MSHVRAVIVDWGGVLALPPSEAAVARLRVLSGLDHDTFSVAWLRHRHAYDLGALDAREYWRRVGAEGERRYDEATLEKLLAEDAASWAVPNTPMVTWLAALKAAGLKVVLLSNTPGEQWATLRPTLRWLHLCDEVLLSFELGLAKPDPAIYSHCLERLGMRPDEALFIDDRAENVSAAAAMGIHAILFTTVESFRSELRERLGEGPPLP